jgi:hypothetical protein
MREHLHTPSPVRGFAGPADSAIDPQKMTAHDLIDRTAVERICSRSERSERGLVCGAFGCSRTDYVEEVTHPDRGSRVLCPACRKDYLGVST